MVGRCGWGAMDMAAIDGTNGILEKGIKLRIFLDLWWTGI